MSDNPLGMHTVYPEKYDSKLLVAIPRVINRESLKIPAIILPFQGFDIWNAYEISWLNTQGKPQVCIGRFIVPCDSINLIESKSLKLYLNSHNQQRYENITDIQSLLAADLSRAAGGEVLIELSKLSENEQGIHQASGFCLDTLNAEFINYNNPDAELLCFENDSADDEKFEEKVEEKLYTNLFRSNCPITHQPDWATVSIDYRGRQISGISLLEYLVSYRQHSDYHEHCIERIFMDLMQRCEPEFLTVQANFLRRGGLDINPIRSTEGIEVTPDQFHRQIRQ